MFINIVSNNCSSHEIIADTKKNKIEDIPLCKFEFALKQDYDNPLTH